AASTAARATAMEPQVRDRARAPTIPDLAPARVRDLGRGTAIPVRAANRGPATVTGMAARAAETARPAPVGTAAVRAPAARAVKGPQAADRGSRSITKCRAALPPG